MSCWTEKFQGCWVRKQWIPDLAKSVYVIIPQISNPLKSAKNLTNSKRKHLPLLVQEEGGIGMTSRGCLFLCLSIMYGGGLLKGAMPWDPVVFLDSNSANRQYKWSRLDQNLFGSLYFSYPFDSFFYWVENYWH